MVASAGSLDPTAQLAPRPTVPATGRGCLDAGAVLLAGALVVISQPPHLSRAASAVRVACAREARRLAVGSVTNGKRGRLRRVRLATAAARAVARTPRFGEFPASIQGIHLIDGRPSREYLSQICEDPDAASSRRVLGAAGRPETWITGVAS